MKTNAKLCFANTFSHSWVTGKYIPLGSYSIGDVVDTTPTTSAGGCNYQSFSVKAGDTIQLRVQGGSNPRAYAILDVNNRLLEMADAGASIDKTLTIANDGTLIVNNNSSSPTLVHKGVREPSAIYLNGYAKRVHLGADKVWIRKDEPMYIGANQEMTWSAVGSYITTSGDIGSVVDFTPVSAPSWQYSIVSVKKGDVFLLTGSGGNSPRAWAFLDNSRKLISKSDAQVTASVLPLTAPSDGYLVVNNDSNVLVSAVCKRVNPHKYDTVKIGNQVWMASNLDENLGLLQSNQWYYNNDKATYGKYSKLYTWTNLNTNLSAILPSGWRWATKTDFETLITSCGGTSVAGKVLKNDSWGWSSGLGTDEQNFGGVGAGSYDNSTFSDINTTSRQWTATALDSSNSYVFGVGTGDSAGISSVGNATGRSVRLVRDDAVYVLPTTSFTDNVTAPINSGYKLLASEGSGLDNWTLFYNITNPVSSSNFYNYLLFLPSGDGQRWFFANRSGGDRIGLVVTRIGSTFTRDNPAESGKCALRRKSGEAYIQWTADGKTWHNTSMPNSFTATTGTLRFGGDGSACVGSGTISAKLWDSAKEDIREYFE